MNQGIDAASELLANPPKELVDLMKDPQTSDEARSAVTDVAPPSSALKNLNGTATKDDASAGRLQIVNENQEFTGQLSQHLAQWDLLDKGFAYDVVSVFGSQSTGKSTLLNRLFGTTFDVMDESKRQQTTKGIWMCPSKYSSTLVMDVEGTDGRERGEDQDFERKSALFSLASTEVLLVNMWEHQIGLYQGANMALLKTVFEVNLGLFGGGADMTKPRTKEKTLILFVIRDHVGATPMENLTNTLKADMEKIWASLSKPPHLAESTLSEYFDLSFTALPHKILMPEKFESAVLELRKRFTDREREDYVFQPGYHKRIPADGVGFYMENIWQQVLTNKDLDLPTQQELLAQFRCDEIAAVATEAFLASSKATRKPVEAGSVVEGLGALLRDWLDVAMGKFDRDASRYHPSVYKRKRADLLAALHASLSPLYLGQLKNLHKQAIVRFDKELKEGLGKAGYEFGELVRGCKDTARNGFEGAAKEMHVEETGWSYEHELALLDEDLGLIADQRRSDETKKMVNAIERSVKKQLLEPVEVALSKPSPKMWDEVLEQYQTARATGEKTYSEKAKSFGCTSEENTTALANLSSRTWLSLRRKLEEQTSDANLLSTLRAAFEERFRYDDSGVPRVWKAEDDVEGVFIKAKEETLALLPLFSQISPSSPSLLPTLPPLSSLDDPSLLSEEDLIAFDPSTAFTLLSPTKLLHLEQRFKREADAAFVEAKRSMVSSVASVPLWMYGALAVLGWNEAMAVLFNPVYFALVLVGLASAYIILQLGLAGPAIQLTMTVLREGKKIAADKIREAVREADAATAPASSSSHPHSRTGGNHSDKDKRLADPIEARNRTGEKEGDLMAEMMRQK